MQLCLDSEGSQWRRISIDSFTIASSVGEMTSGLCHAVFQPRSSVSTITKFGSAAFRLFAVVVTAPVLGDAAVAAATARATVPASASMTGAWRRAQYAAERSDACLRRGARAEHGARSRR